MAKFSEETLKNWTKPPSDSEETKLENAERMVKEAIDEFEGFKGHKIEVFGQGSYANNTNVRLNSDIDINVMYMDVFYFKLPKDKKREDYGLNSPSNYTFAEYKNSVEAALVQKFGRDNVVRNNKCITILGNFYRVEADAVPTFKYRRYYEDKTYSEGAKFKSDTGDWIINYPKQHIKNGINKNTNTYRRFKRLTRIHKRLRYKMIDEGIAFPDSVKSFLLECLVWNLPNSIFNDYDTWTERLKQSIIYLYNNTNDEDKCDKWTEVSRLLYLFHSGRKWTKSDAKDYMVALWNYMEFNKET